MDRGAVALQINEGHPSLVHLPQPPPELSPSRRKIELNLCVPDGRRRSSGLELTVGGRSTRRSGGSATSRRTAPGASAASTIWPASSAPSELAARQASAST